LATIQIIQGADKGRTFRLKEGDNIVGRQSSTVQLTDTTVSRHHSCVKFLNGKWVLEDLGSANGTFLNGMKITHTMPLNLGDQFRCGSTLLVFSGLKDSSMLVDLDNQGNLVDAAIVARIPSNEDSVIIPTPEAGAQAIGNLRILYDFISEVGSIFNIHFLLKRTLEKVVEVLKAERGYIMLRNEQGKLQLETSYLRDDQNGESGPIPVSKTIINEVIQGEVGVLSSNAMSDRRFSSGKSVHDYGIRSAICVPIKGRERILGVIHIDCSVSDQTYSTEQLRLLTAIGFQTGLAVENVRLYEAAIQSERLTAVGETVAALSHHIKNILQALAAGIDVVEMAIKQENLGKAQNAWPIVQRNLARINELILNMLTFSKERDPLLESINVNDVLAECIELHNSVADERGIVLIADLADLPPIPADMSGLQQAFTNLISNALDAVNDGNGVITLSTEYDSLNRRVHIRITDNGKGIEPNQLAEIFNPFWSSKGQKGTGLGLAVTHKIISEHQGKIDVSSTPGEGTTFIVSLPAMRSENS
jgi:signal transduction histidine kinase